MLVPFASLIFLSMDTAKDRENYLRFFSDPFAPVRWEPGFVWFGRAISFGFSPEMSIVILCSISYLLFSYSWQKVYSNNFLTSFLSFHLTIYLLFNYFLGTAIRNGFAAALTLGVFAIVIKKKNFIFSLLLLAGPAFHLGASLFSIFGWLFSQIYKLKFAMTVGFSVSTIAIFIFLFILPSHMSGYYSIYFEAGETSSRFRSFSMIAYALCVILLLLSPEKNVWSKISLLPTPLLIFYLFSGFEVLARLLAPFYFMAVASTFKVCNLRVSQVCGSNFLGLLLIFGNFLGLAYALRQWGFF